MKNLKISNPFSFDGFQCKRQPMKGFKVFNLSLSAAIAVISFAASPLLALPNNGSGTSQSDLENQGYKCVRVSVNFKECTKDGSPTYWCTDAGVCEPAPKQNAPIRKRPGNLQQLPTLDRNSIGQ